jgi:BlaI family transcriptional regulator, penicillinase repressor
VGTGPHGRLSRRERQIVEILYRAGRATVRDIRARMADPPSYSAVRTTVNILESKGFVTHSPAAGGPYVYTPTVSRGRAARGMLQHVLATYFDNSVEKAVAALLQVRAGDLTEEDLDRLARLVRNGR